MIRFYTHPEIITACCQNGFVSMELLLPGHQSDITQKTIFPLLVEGRQDGVLMRLGLTESLSCQHLPANGHTQIIQLNPTQSP